MRSGSIDQPLAKLGRAAKHYRVIKEDFFGGYDRQNWPVALERYRDGLEYRVRAGEIEPLPRDLPLILGDAYYNLRAALDYLVYQLHLRHYRGSVPPKVMHDSAFPILSQQRIKGGVPLPTTDWREIGSLGKRERTAIEWLQPYQRRGGSIVKDLRVTLSDLSIVNNFDKHRELHATRSIPQAVRAPRFAPELGFRQHPAFGITLESGAYIDTWTFAKAPPAEQMNMKLSFRSAIEIKPGTDRLEEPAHLGGSILAVEAIIKRFGHLFPPPPEPLDLSWVRMREEPP